MTGSVGSELIALAWPILCSGILAVLDTSLNMMWVGRELGEVAVAALSNANLLWMFLFAAAFGVSTAAVVRIGQRIGADDMAGARAAVATEVSVAAVISIVCALSTAVWARPLLVFLGTPAAAVAPAVSYLRMLLLSVPLTYLNVALISALQATGDSRTGFCLSASWVAIDAALNPLFIVGAGPLPPLGISGSALATVVSQAIGLAALLCLIYGTEHPLRVRVSDVRMLLLELKRAPFLLRESGAMSVQFLWASIEEMLMISLVNRFGTDTTAGYGAIIQAWNLIMMPAIALSVAITAILAQNIGAGRWDRVWMTARIGVVYGVVATSALVAVAEILDSRIYEVFLSAGSPALAVAREVNREATWGLCLLGAYTVWIGVLRATGSIWAPLAISGAVLAVRFPVTAALLSSWHSRAIWWSFPASAVATSVLAALHGWVIWRGPRHLARSTAS
jgi:putative MATE family efflux protein